MGHWVDPNITEASGLGYSLTGTSEGYTHNDEDGLLRRVSFATGQTVGTMGIDGHTLVDPEDVDVDKAGQIWWADIGDNDEVRSTVAVYVHEEFGHGNHGDVDWTRYVLRYPGGASHNAETFICWPNGKKQIVSKTDEGAVYQLPSTLSSVSTNDLTAVHGPDAKLKFVSGGVASRDGKWAFILCKDENTTIFVFNSSWKRVGVIKMKPMTKPEGITIQRDGKTLIVCDVKGGTGGKFQKVPIPPQWRPQSSPGTPTPSTPSATSTYPANGLIVSVPQPRLAIVSPLVNHIGLNVQISATQDGTSPDWSISNFNDQGTYSIDLADQPGAPSLAVDGTTSYRMALIGVTGQISDWSAWSEYTYVPLGSASIIEPPESPDNVVFDPSPPIIWDFPDQTAYRLFIEDPSLPPVDAILYDSNVVTSNAQGAIPGSGVCVISGHTYRVRLRLWDSENRVSKGGAADYVEVTRDFEFQLDATVDPVSAFTVTDLNPNPFVKLSWERSTPADWFQILRDGEQVAYVEALAVLVSGDSYEWIDLLADPRREHTWTVRAVVNNQTSAVNPSQTLTFTPSGLWLSQPYVDRFLPVITTEAQSVGLTEDGGTFNPLNSRYGVRISGSKRGYSGTITGEILATELTDTATGASLRDLFRTMRADREETYCLTLLDRNIKIVPFNMTVAPTPTIGHNEDYVYAMSFDFIEVP